ncbi:MAG: hypothetical protein KatS3mg109_1262 [Pirellulaceae bacterium]|nr:MAG: hypothetical protein KatS3mg109_1262 [Pirellulaceae bacterium]
MDYTIFCGVWWNKLPEVLRSAGTDEDEYKRWLQAGLCHQLHCSDPPAAETSHLPIDEEVAALEFKFTFEATFTVRCDPNLVSARFGSPTAIGAGEG